MKTLEQKIEELKAQNAKLEFANKVQREIINAQRTERAVYQKEIPTTFHNANRDIHNGKKKNRTA